MPNHTNHRAVFELIAPLRVFVVGYTVAMVPYCVTKMIKTCSPVIGQFFDTMIVASSDKESTSFPGSFPWLGGVAPKPGREKTLGTRLIKSGYNNPSQSKC